MKTNKKTIAINFYGDPFPHALGLMIWSQLPNQIPIHFNFAWPGQ